MSQPELQNPIGIDGPIAPELGHALIVLFEPHRGHEHAYNRWYEDDHFTLAAKCVPWVFGTRRFVAPRELRALRPTPARPAFSPIDAGCYLSLVWTLAGHGVEASAWIAAMMARLRSEDRTFAERTRIHGGFLDRLANVRFRGDGPTEFHALDYPYPTAVIEVMEPGASTTRSQLLEWLVTHHCPSKLDTPAAQCVIFGEGPKGPLFDPPTGPSAHERLTLVWFFDAEPEAVWEGHFVNEERALASDERAVLLLAAPFQATRPGTQDFVDKLR